MGEAAIIISLLFAAGALVLVAEVFIPSHGVLSVVGVTLLVVAVARTFTSFGQTAGMLAVLGCVVLVPTGAVVAVKNWYRTPVGKRLAPPNRELTSEDVSVDLEKLRHYLGTTGTVLSPLRPVGTCEFDGARVQCVAELGVLDKGTTVKAVGIRGANLAVVRSEIAQRNT